MTYKLTVILPVYNVNNYLDRALESIRAQTIGFENIEVIFVDDKSTDNSDEKIKLYANEYDNIVPVFTYRTPMPFGAWNLCPETPNISIFVFLTSIFILPATCTAST